MRLKSRDDFWDMMVNVTTDRAMDTSVNLVRLAGPGAVEAVVKDLANAGFKDVNPAIIEHVLICGCTMGILSLSAACDAMNRMPGFSGPSDKPEEPADPKSSIEAENAMRAVLAKASKLH
jgi:hypothetical protein